MKCREFRRWALDAEEDSRARDPRLSEELSRHRDECSGCRGFADRLAAARELLRAPANRDTLPDAGFSSRVVASLPEPASPLGWAAMRLLPATTALALVLLGWCWLETPSPAELLERSGEDDLLTWVLTP